jgi:hypothetical protein
MSEEKKPCQSAAAVDRFVDNFAATYFSANGGPIKQTTRTLMLSRNSDMGNTTDG